MLDCFACGGMLFKVQDGRDCCSSCGRMDIYRERDTYDLPKMIVTYNEGEQNVK
jgi:uncharacterized Zn finger protein (UPF0148 family)